MSHIVSPPEGSWDAHHERPPTQPTRLLAVLAGAVLFVLGIALGGFMARSDSHTTVAGLEAELNALRAQISLLNDQATLAQSRQFVMEQLWAGQQRLATRNEEREQHAAARQRFIGQAIEMTNSHRLVCLNELRAYKRFRSGVPSEQVMRFAESLFDRQTQILDSLAAGRPNPSIAALDLRTLLAPTGGSTPQATPADSEIIGVSEASRIRTRTIAKSKLGPTLADPGEATIHSRSRKPEPAVQTVSSPPRAQGVFFTPPQRRKSGMTFITPRRTSRVASQRGSGISFSDETDGPILR